MIQRESESATEMDLLVLCGFSSVVILFHFYFTFAESEFIGGWSGFTSLPRSRAAETEKKF
jgi:hypothetical protein